MKRLYIILKLLLCADVGLFTGLALYEVLRYKLHPELYLLNSAPWYTGILLSGAATGLAAVILGAALLILRRVKNRCAEDDANP